LLKYYLPLPAITTKESKVTLDVDVALKRQTYFPMTTRAEISPAYGV